MLIKFKEHNYSVRNVKTLAAGPDGQPFSLTLCENDKPIAKVRDEGHGGGFDYEWLDKTAKERMDKFLAAHPGFPSDPDDPNSEMLPLDADILVDELLTKFQAEKWLRGKCSKETLFRLDGDQEGTWRTVKAPFDPKVKSYLDKKYGDKVQEIANERFLPSPAATTSQDEATGPSPR